MGRGGVCGLVGSSVVATVRSRGVFCRRRIQILNHMFSQARIWDQESCRRTLSNKIVEEESCAEIGVGGSNVSDVVAADSGLSDNLAGDSSGSDTAVVSRMVLHPPLWPSQVS